MLLDHPSLKMHSDAQCAVSVCTFYQHSTRGFHPCILHLQWRSSKTAAVLVLSVVTLPYTAFLWWLTLGRIWKLPEVSHPQQSPHV